MVERIITAISCAVLALWHAPTVILAQGTLRSPEAAVEDLRDGRMDNPALFMFEACPQDDPVGRAVFEAVRDVELAPERLEELALALNWRGHYGTCGYGPLDTWFLQTANQLITQRSGTALWSFVHHLTPNIPDEMQGELLAAAEDESWDEPFRSMLAGIAIFGRPPDRQVDEALAAFRGNVPGEWIFSASLRLSRTFGSTFFTRLAAVAPTLPDAALDKAAGAVANEILDGTADPHADGMDALRREVARRPAVRSWNQIPERSSPRR